MKLAKYLKPETVFVGKEFSSVHDSSMFLCEEVVKHLSIQLDEIKSQVEEREKQSSTAIGNCVAVPHARIDDLDSIYISAVVLEKPITYETPDDEDIKIVFMFYLPLTQLRII